MVDLEIRPATSRKKDSGGNRLFTAYYGTVPIVDIRASGIAEAEEKLVFVLASGLRGKTIDFDASKLS